jgi:serine/threonine-protein kinase
MSMVGAAIAHYEITGKLGQGGMGEVYRAKDKKLGREVAIKVLPEAFASDPDRIARFQREARVLASLNHPNIAAIYGLEESGGTKFLVMELVAGETLAERIKRGAIAVEEALKLALQIAEALEAAHEKGVIHRDLKPANIIVTPEGKVKVLDFGVAKALAGEPVEADVANSPTLSDAATRQGIILGTAAYMSPEQAKGKPVDKRADIWASGVVLFEMLTGRQLFTGETISDTLASVLKTEPEWNRLPQNLHPRIRLLLERCLRKDAKDRYGAISDGRVDIQEALADPGGVFGQPIAATGHRGTFRTMLPWLAAAVVVGAIAAGVAVWTLRGPETRQVMRSQYSLPEGQRFTSPLYLPILAVSPDGKQFVYSTNNGLYVRSLDEFDAKLIVGTETDPSTPFFSPDGKWIGYWSQADHKLKKIAISGGAPVILCDAPALVAGASWGADDRIVYAEYQNGIKRVSANGGIPEMIVKGAAYLPQLLPDAKSLLFTFGSAPYKVIVQSLQSGERKELLAGDNARYISTGHIVYSVENNLFAVPFDLKTFKVTGGPAPLVEGVWRLRAVYPPQYAVSDSGTLVYVPGATDTAGPQRTLAWVDRNGKEQPLAAPPNAYGAPRISPDGTRVALTVGAGEPDIWIWDLVRKTMTRLTFDKQNSYSLWTPDGKRIAYASMREDTKDTSVGVYWKAADGTGVDEKLASAPDRQFLPGSWSSDGRTLVVVEATGGGNDHIGMLSMEGDRNYRPLLHEKYNEFRPQISPDGQWMAYMSDESGQDEIYVRPFPDVNNGRWQVSTGGGSTPLWAPNGRELLYRSGDSVIAVSVQTEPAFRLGTPKTLFRGTYVTGVAWDISPDGKRFLMIKELASATTATEGPRKINIVLNWFEELKQRVPVK